VRGYSLLPAPPARMMPFFIPLIISSGNWWMVNEKNRDSALFIHVNNEK